MSSSDNWRGQRATLNVSETVTKLTIFGTTVEQDVSSQSWSDPETGAPFYQNFRIESGGSVTLVTALFTPSSITAVLKSGKETTTKVIPIPPGQKIVVEDTEGMTSTAPLKIGDTESDLEFDPISLSLDSQVSHVVALDIPVKEAKDGQVHATDEVVVSDPQGSATAFQDNTATPVLIIMPAGLYMVLTDEGHALDPRSLESSYALNPTSSPGNEHEESYDPAPDLAIATAVSPSGQQLHDERSLMHLTVKLTVRDETPKTVTENAIPVPPAGSLRIDQLNSSETAPFLLGAPYLSIDDPTIISTSHSIVGTETDAYKAVKLLHDWVYSHLTPEGQLGLPRSASDICANPEGVCRDYAVLYTALARAAGIPTKIEAGLVGFHGRFYYHAWASSFIGGSIGWLPVDATLPTMFVDASHISLGSGDPTVMFSLADVIGNMKVETLNTRNSL